MPAEFENLLFPKKIFKDYITSKYPNTHLQKGVTSRLSECAVLFTSFLGSSGSINDVLVGFNDDVEL